MGNIQRTGWGRLQCWDAELDARRARDKTVYLTRITQEKSVESLRHPKWLFRLNAVQLSFWTSRTELRSQLLIVSQENDACLASKVVRRSPRDRPRAWLAIKERKQREEVCYSQTDIRTTMPAGQRRHHASGLDLTVRAFQRGRPLRQRSAQIAKVVDWPKRQAEVRSIWV